MGMDGVWNGEEQDKSSHSSTSICHLVSSKSHTLPRVCQDLSRVRRYARLARPLSQGGWSLAKCAKTLSKIAGLLLSRYPAPTTGLQQPYCSRSNTFTVYSWFVALWRLIRSITKASWPILNYYINIYNNKWKAESLRCRHDGWRQSYYWTLRKQKCEVLHWDTLSNYIQGDVFVRIV
jgi:hypothetical protein